MEITGVVQDQVENYPYPLTVGSCQKAMKRCQITKIWMNTFEISDVISTIPQWGWIDRRQPKGFHPKPTQVRQTRCQTFEVTNAIAVPVGVAANDQLVDNRS